MRARGTGPGGDGGDARHDDVPHEDARYEDASYEAGAEGPLRLRAETAGDLEVLSALVQDAVARVGDIAWTPRRRRLTLLLGRFRWEDAAAARRQRRPFERVRALLTIGGALKVRSEGIDPRDKETVVSLLALDFQPGDDGAGVLRLVFAGDGAIEVEAECLDATLTDVSQPYAALSKRLPGHPE